MPICMFKFKLSLFFSNVTFREFAVVCKIVAIMGISLAYFNGICFSTANVILMLALLFIVLVGEKVLIFVLALVMAISDCFSYRTDKH